jgi:predicted nucleic acid-binding Zn ribbon protein
LGKVLPRVLAKQPRAALVAEFRVRQAFREVLGEALAMACETIEVRGSTVSVSTGNPALAHQLRLDAEQLMQRLNAQSRMTRPVLAIKVRIGRPAHPRGG